MVFLIVEKENGIPNLQGIVWTLDTSELLCVLYTHCSL